VKLEDRLVVERDRVELAGRDSTFGEAIPSRVEREARVVLLAREAFFLRSCDDLAAVEKTGSRVVIVGADPQDFHQN